MNFDDFENVIPKKVDNDEVKDLQNKIPSKHDATNEASDLQNQKPIGHDSNDSLDKMDTGSKGPDADAGDLAQPSDASPKDNNFFDTSSDHYTPTESGSEGSGGAPADPQFDQNDANYDNRHDGYHGGEGGTQGDSGDKSTTDSGKGNSEISDSKPNLGDGANNEAFIPDKVFGDLAGNNFGSSSGSSSDSVASTISKGAKQAANTGLSILKAVSSTITGGLTTIASALGTSVKAVKIVGSMTGSLSIILILALLLGMQKKTVIEPYEEDCALVEEQANSNHGSEMDDFDMTASAKEIYSALASDSIGYSDQAIAGMLSNGQAESSLNPHTYEGNYLTNADMVKKAEEKDWNGYTLLLFQAYYRSGKSIKESAYMYKGKYYPAFGIWQWTGPRTGGLMEFANATDDSQEWADGEFTEDIYSLDVQLAYLLKENCNGVNEWARGRSSSQTPYEAATWFWSNWEGANTAKSKHCDNAQSWYDTITSEGWATDNTYGASIIEMAQIELTEAGAKGVHSAYEDSICEEPEVNNFDNSSTAAAAVSWAWPQGHSDYADINDSKTLCCPDKGIYKMTFCTSQYIYCHNLVLQGIGTHASSCDRGVAVAIRVAGIDDSFSPGFTSSCMAHMASSERWEKIGVMSEDLKPKLKPGDILVNDNHIVVFVGGKDAVKKWPDLYKSEDECKYGIVHASHSSKYAADGSNSRGPRFDPDMGTGFNGTYYVFRATGRESSSKYKNLVDANKTIISAQHNGSTKADHVSTSCSEFEDKLFGMKNE